MQVLCEFEYAGERYAGFHRPAPGEPYTLYRVAEGQVRDAFIGAGDPGAAVAAITGAAEPVVAMPDGDLRPLPPLLPAEGGNALLSGFMRTHRSKFDDQPGDNEEFVPPNWFFKGFGSWLRMPDEPLRVPPNPVALIEEPEVALVYANDGEGTPHYIGYTFGNDLCDIGLHLQNPGWNPYCKLCDTSIAPWLFLGAPPRSATGRVTIERGRETAWEGEFDCGADALYFPIEDMMNNLFFYPALRRPFLVNYVLLGADRASFHDGFRIADGDRVAIHFTDHDVVVSNTVEFGHAGERLAPLP
ncbi:fumarylacetoacetate (FAA) hydrolase [Streptomonospora sp. PA3]|uniref:fumarylacetoacetate (FAA) hydrolase n=1 Tax=Streptomonospora sp. PA3 TaxID=2607326 RepID=UPI0012DD4A34|nr:fumarylacetoacetate (FAA) hydrolase [Streptomonospora sp. PA3]MUL41074.1 fumarylacetoacetate (FAA) hydrolase [Streptomonospora sp. PA3]